MEWGFQFNQIKYKTTTTITRNNGDIEMCLTFYVGNYFKQIINYYMPYCQLFATKCRLEFGGYGMGTAMK